MTTRIKRSVQRQTETNFSNYGADRLPIIVSIEPGDVLGFRLLGRRTTYRVLIATAMRHAIELTIAQRKAEKKRKRGTAK